MTPKFEPGGIRKTRPWEYLARFVFGGAVTAATGLIVQHFGPVVGGLFLAFPAILPASLTLVEQHDGPAAAADDARGACLGTFGLAAFALVTWRAGARWSGVIVLTAATLAWLAVSVLAWAFRYGRQESIPRTSSRRSPGSRALRRTRRSSVTTGS
jgi:hypothetical protein